MIRKDQVITVQKAQYMEDYKLQVTFNDGRIQIIDFADFLLHSTNPHIQKYRELELFKDFQITDGDLEWNDYDLCFPVADLYENRNIGHRSSGSDEAA